MVIEGLRKCTVVPMRLFKWLVRPVYSVERRSSTEQLREDFGDFPPAPLCAEGVTGDFDVVRVRGIGEVLARLNIFNRALKGLDTDTLSPDFKDSLGAELLEVRRTFFGGSRAVTFMKRGMIVLMLCVIGLRMTIRMIRSSDKESTKLGCFIPVREHESNIFVSVERHNKRGRSEAPTISHEHIHLLQHKDPECHARNTRNLEILLTERGQEDPFLLYLLQKDEVEARLHESVLSFYRSYRQLPMTVPKFLGMLAASQQFGDLVRLTLENSGVSFDQEIEPFTERDGMFVEQLDSIFVYIQTPELTSRFITEVLSVMYGNLLRYYGDEDASGNYLKNIERPNFYDELYGT